MYLTPWKQCSFISITVVIIQHVTNIKMLKDNKLLPIIIRIKGKYNENKISVI